MKKLVAAAMFVLFGALFACVSRADAVPPTTNDWFDVSFEALTADTVIAQGDTTGITRGAGSWTSVPENGTATIVADEDAGGEATCLSLNAPGEELTLTPAAFGSPSDIETVSVQVKADAIDELPVLDGNVQGAFTVLLDENDALSAQGWTTTGWTNLVYAATDGLTNAWFTLYVDFATAGGVRIVRYSVKPATGSLSVLSDANGDTWFTAATNATVVSSVSLSGIGSIRTINGDSLTIPGVATYNGVGYDTLDAAIAAAVADEWANGNVVLMEDAEWVPTATGTYHIDVNGHSLAVSGASKTVDGTTYTISRLTNYYWIGGESTEWANGSNWSHAPGGTPANEYPNADSDYAYFPDGASLTLNSFVYVRKIFTDGTLTLAGNGDGGVRTNPNNNTSPLTFGGTGLLRLAGITIHAPYATSADGGQSRITNDVEIVYGTTNYVRASGASDRAASLVFQGRLSGGGRLVAWSNTGLSKYQVYFSGDASQFTGSIADHRDEDDYGKAIFVNFNSASALSGLATYDLSATYASGGKNFVLHGGGTGTTYKMGALNGEVHFDGNNNGKSDQYYGYTLEIGGKNENCSFGGELARNGYSSSTKKVGTADMTFTGSQIPNITIEDGTYIIGSETALPDTMIFTGGAFSVAEGLAVDPPSKFSSDSTAPVVFDDRGLDNTWAGRLENARVPFGFTKKGAGTLTLTTMPTHTTKTTIEDGVLIVPQGTTIAQLSCEGGKLAVPLAGTEDETTVLNITALAEGTDYDALTNAVAIPGATVAVQSDVGSGYIVKATRTPQTLTWSGAIDNDWSKGGNWAVDGAVAITAPIAIDTVSFVADCTVALGGTVSASNVVIASEATVTLGGGMLAGIYEFGAEEAKGGKFVLAGASLEGASIAGGSYLSWYGDIEIAGDASVTNYIHCRNLDNSSNTSALRLYGNLTGSGNLCLDRTGHTSGGSYDGRGGVSLYGDNEAFSGVCIIRSGSSTRGPATFCSATAGSGLARWIYPDAVDQNTSARAGTSTINGGTIKLGTYEGTNYFFACESSHDNNVIEIGGKGVDFACSLSAKCRTNAERGNINTTLRKVGAGTMTFENELGQPYMAKWDLAGGILHLANPNISKFDGGYDGKTKITPEFNFTGGALSIDDTCTVTVEEKTSLLDVSAYVKNSTAAIGIVVSEGQSLTWATALDVSNSGGLTKKGAGTLTLSAAPKYTGWTTVEEGELIVPTDTELDVCFAGGTLTGARYGAVSFADGYKFTTGTDARILASGAADVSNLVIYIADPTADDVYRVLRASGGVSGEPTLAFPEDTSDELKARWALKIGSKSVSVGTYDIGSRLILK